MTTKRKFTQLSLTPNEHAALKALAKRRGVTVTGLVRELIAAEQRRQEPVYKN